MATAWQLEFCAMESTNVEHQILEMRDAVSDVIKREKESILFTVEFA